MDLGGDIGRVAGTDRRYLAYRLTVRSELPLPGGVEIAEGDPRLAGGCDLSVVRGRAAIEGPARALGLYRHAEGKLLFELPGIGRYLCAEDGCITVERLQDASDDLLADYLVATALPAMLWMRGEIVLHAAAAVLPGASRAVAIGGASGSGKSTVLRQLVAAGARMIADDTIRLRFSGDEIEVSGLAGGYFLAGAGQAERAFHAVPPESRAESAALGGIALLGLPRRETAEWRRLGGVDALEALLASRHRPRVPALLGRDPAVLATLAAIAARVPVVAWSRANGAALDAGEQALLAGLS